MGALNCQLIFMFFTFALSIGVPWAAESRSRTPRWEASLSRHTVASSHQRRATRKKRKFKLVGHFSEGGSVEKYESSDGQEVSLYLACWTGTARAARQEMQRMISEGKVIRKGRRYYGHGRQRRLGARTVAVYPPDESGEKPAKIFWYVEGSCFNFIEAGSLELALEFERSEEFAEVEGW